MHRALRKPQAYPWRCREFSQNPDGQKIGADRVKNRSYLVKVAVPISWVIVRTRLDKQIERFAAKPFKASYQKAHVPGAVQFLFPIPDMNEWNAKETDGKSQNNYVQLLGGDKTKPIVIYCGFVKCTRSHNGAAWAVKLGYKNVYRYSGGIFAWKGAKYPVEKAE
jgi:rhodanese-related sulfurtransferase